MAGINDAFTVGIIFIFLIGAVFFYFYTRLSQVEKRMKLLETILLDLKVATENSFVGFPAPTESKPDDDDDTVYPGAVIETSAAAQTPTPTPTPKNIFEEIDSELLTADEWPGQAQEPVAAKIQEHEPSQPSVVQTEEPVAVAADGQAQAQAQAQAQVQEPHTANYEFQTLKELQALAKHRGIAGTSGMKRAALIDLLKQKDDLATPVKPFDDEPLQEVTGENADEVFGQMAPIE